MGIDVEKVLESNIDRGTRYTESKNNLAGQKFMLIVAQWFLAL